MRCFEICHPSIVHFGEAFYRLCPDILIIRGWKQSDLDAGLFPTPHSPGVSLLFMEYKTANDFYFPEKCKEIWDAYTPTDATSPRLHLLRALRALGWTVHGLDAQMQPGTSSAHDRLVPILIGHGAFVPAHTLSVVFCRILDMRLSEATALANALVRHQALATDKIMSIVYRLLKQPGSTQITAPGSNSADSRAGVRQPRGIG